MTNIKIDAYLFAAIKNIENGRPLTSQLRAVLQSITPGPLPFGAEMSGFVGDDRKSLASFVLLTNDRAETLKAQVLDWFHGAKAKPAAEDQDRVIHRVLDLRGAPSNEIRAAGELGSSAGWGIVAEQLRRRWNPIRKEA